MYPELSAIPIPNIPTKTTPSGANPVKLDTAFSIIYLNPSPLRSDTAFIVWTSISLVVLFIISVVTSIPIAAVIADIIATATHNIANNVTGCGSLFPPISTKSRNFCRAVFFSVFCATELFIFIPPFIYNIVYNVKNYFYVLIIYYIHPNCQTI